MAARPSSPEIYDGRIRMNPSSVSMPATRGTGSPRSGMLDRMRLQACARFALELAGMAARSSLSISAMICCRSATANRLPSRNHSQVVTAFSATVLANRASSLPTIWFTIRRKSQQGGL